MRSTGHIQSRPGQVRAGFRPAPTIDGGSSDRHKRPPPCGLGGGSAGHAPRQASKAPRFRCPKVQCIVCSVLVSATRALIGSSTASGVDRVFANHPNAVSHFPSNSLAIWPPLCGMKEITLRSSINEGSHPARVVFGGAPHPTPPPPLLKTSRSLQSSFADSLNGNTT